MTKVGSILFEVTEHKALMGSTTNVGLAAFGPQLFDVSGEVIAVKKGAAIDGCVVPFDNAAALAGKIALIERGNCTFETKVKNAQDAGAIAVIIYDNMAATAPLQMPDDPAVNGVTIPSMFIIRARGTTIKSTLDMGTTVKVRRLR